MNARRATWILFFGVVAFCVGVTEVALRVMFHESKWLDPAENELWYLALQDTSHLHYRGRDIMHDPVLAWRMQPNLDFKGVHTNKWGMRGAIDYPKERVEGKKRVMLLGDSFTHGLGAKDEDVYGRVVERNHDDVEVLICASNSWGLDQMYLEYERYKHDFDPDVIVVGIYEDDILRAGVDAREYIKPRFIVKGDELELTNVPIPTVDKFDPSMVPLDHRPRIVDAAEFVYKRIKLSNTGNYMWDSKFEELTKVTQYLLRDLKALAAKQPRKPQIVVLVWGSMHYESAYDSVRLRQMVVDTAQALELPVVDFTDRLHAKSKSGVQVYDPAHAHWTQVGHEIAAQALEEQLQKIGFFGP